MDNVEKRAGYQPPTVVDYGDLQELTAACLGGVGGDVEAPGGVAGDFTVGVSNPGAGCTSNP
jgi:hypothetical protein